MLKYCSKCGTFHDHNYKHKDSRQKKNTDLLSFYRTYEWTQLSKRVRERDNYLCQYCLHVDDEYTTDNLSVHHIIKAEEDETKRFNESNLITLCTKHHKMADEGKIDEDLLFQWVCDKYF